MTDYLIRRLLLLPITLFCIILVNFVIINLAPGDPVMVTEISPEGQERRDAARSFAFGTDLRYLQFREYYGLTLPILLNFWPYTSLEGVMDTLKTLQHPDEMSLRDYDALRIHFGDKARFIMPLLLHVLQDPLQPMAQRALASQFFARGGTRQGFVGPSISKKEKAANNKIAQDNLFLRKSVFLKDDLPEQVEEKVAGLTKWYKENKVLYHFAPTFSEKIQILFLETRFCRYMSRVLLLNFGTLRNDSNKLVIDEVSKRFKYSLTLAILPMVLMFFVCQLFGVIMAVYQNRVQDMTLNVTFLVLYALPVFVVAPFLIEKVALGHTFPFTDIPIPISGFTSPDPIYNELTSWGRFMDTSKHLVLPLIAVLYGNMASQSKLARTAVLEVLRQDYVRTARAKGLSSFMVLAKHVGRNAAITIVTSVTGSLGLILGGSVIVETLFEINGFGKFFYDAVINRDFNVIMFSAIAGAFLTLCGYLVADIAYTMLDPRVSLEGEGE